jgi:predicted phosphodiesterase
MNATLVSTTFAETNYLKNHSFESGSSNSKIWPIINDTYGKTAWWNNFELKLKGDTVSTQFGITGTTIAYMGDARPSKFGTTGITELTKDFNQVVPQSPSGKVDAIFMIGDMDKIPQTQKAFAASNIRNIPIFYVVGNHEVATNGDLSAIRAIYPKSKIPLIPGPIGTDKTTYSLNVGDIHIVNTNQYWNGTNNDAWFKYKNSDGGYIPDALYNWINNDLSKSSQRWKIVVGHEPLYPKSRHIGDSLDKDPANRDKLQNLFISQKVAVFVGAHTHFAAVNLQDSVYHVDAGVSGQKTIDGEDPYASIFYTHTNADNLILTWKHENPTWATPETKTYIIQK